MRSSLRRSALRAILVAASASSCGTSSSTTPATTDGGVATSCQGASSCLKGTIEGVGLAAHWVDAKADLYDLYPYGSVTPIASAPARSDAFEFGGLSAGATYWILVTAKMDAGASSSLTSVAGPFSANGTAKITVRPVFLEVLQTKQVGAALQASWASARVHDPKTGQLSTSGSAALVLGAQRFDMKLGPNLAGQQSFFVQLPDGTPGGTSFAIETNDPALGPAPKTWNLTAELPGFEVALQAPADASTIALNAPLEVRWAAQPSASYALVELFQVVGTSPNVSFSRVYTSPKTLSASATQETIPAKSIAAAGKYLLNVRQAVASCPAASDGCVYSTSTAAAVLTAQ